MKDRFEQDVTETDRILEISRMFWNSAVLRTAIQLQLFPILEEGAMTATELASRLGTDRRYTEAFLGACMALGLIESTDGFFENTRAVSLALIPGKSSYLGDLVLHVTNHSRSFENLGEALRDGRSLPPYETGFMEPGSYWRDYMRGQHNRAMAGQGHYLAERVDLSDKRRLLDVGGGCGSYSISLCEAYPNLGATVVDQSEALVVARDVLKEHDCRDRIDLLEGDFMTCDLGDGYDVALLSGVSCILSPEACSDVLRRIYEALAPGGLCILQDHFRIPDSPHDFFDAMTDFYLLIAYNRDSGNRDEEELRSLLSAVGFVDLDAVHVPTQFEILTAIKP